MCDCCRHSINRQLNHAWACQGGVGAAAGAWLLMAGRTRPRNTDQILGHPHHDRQFCDLCFDAFSTNNFRGVYCKRQIVFCITAAHMTSSFSNSRWFQCPSHATLRDACNSSDALRQEWRSTLQGHRKRTRPHATADSSVATILVMSSNWRDLLYNVRKSIIIISIALPVTQHTAQAKQTKN